MPLKDIVDYMGHCGWPKAAGIAFSDAGHPSVRGDFYKDPIAPPPAGCRRGGDDHFKVLQFNINFPISAPPYGGFEAFAGLFEHDHIALCGSSFRIRDRLIDLLKAPMG